MLIRIMGNRENIRVAQAGVAMGLGSHALGMNLLSEPGGDGLASRIQNWGRPVSVRDGRARRSGPKVLEWPKEVVSLS